MVQKGSAGGQHQASKADSGGERLRWGGDLAIAGTFGSARPFSWSDPSHEYVKCVDSAWTLFNSVFCYCFIHRYSFIVIFMVLYSG